MSPTACPTGAWAMRCTGEWQVGQLSADEYVRTAHRWAKAMRRLDPDIKLVSCGMNGWNDWDREVVDGMASLVDLHSLHVYTGSERLLDQRTQPSPGRKGYPLYKCVDI